MRPRHVHRFLALLAAASMAFSAQASVDVTLISDTPVAEVGQTVGIRVQLSSPGPSAIAAAQVVFAWDPAELRLLGLSNAGAASLLTSGLPSPDPYGLNEAPIPNDGNGLYLAFARLGHALGVSEEGESVLLTTLLFETLTPTPDAEVTILASAGSPPGRTAVFDGATPNTDVTGALSSATLIVIPAPASPLALLGAGIIIFSRRTRRHD